MRLTLNPAPHAPAKEMDKVRIKQIIREAKRTDDVQELYFEVYGATFAGKVTDEIARQSIVAACKELLESTKLVGQEHKHMATKADIAEIVSRIEEKLDALIKHVTGVQLEESKSEVEIKPAPPGDQEITYFVVANPKCSASDLIRKFKLSNNRAQFFIDARDAAESVKEVPEPTPKKAKIETGAEYTIEQVRERAAKFSEVFGVDALMKLNKRFGGDARVSKLNPSDYPDIMEEMRLQLAQAPDSSVTLEQVKTAAKPFLDANGAPALTGLLRTFGADKISSLDQSKYAAFIEAVTNA